MNFICHICESEFFIEFVNKHHKIPKSLGGDDSSSNLLDLCAGCHQFLHTVARMMRNPKKVGEVRTAVQKLFPIPRSQAKCLELARLECESKILQRNAVQADKEREIGIGLRLSALYRDALQLIARDRKLSMADYTRKIMEEHIRKVYPNLENTK